MSMTAAMEEACASGGEADIVAMELVHPGIENGAVRLVSGIDGPNVDIDTIVMLPIDAAGTKKDFVTCAFEVVRPGSEKKGQTDGKVRIGGANTRLAPILEKAVGYSEPIRLTVWTYLATTLTQVAGLAEPADMMDGLEMPVAQLANGVAEGTITYPDGSRINLPTGDNAFFDRDNYSGLFS